MGSKILLADDSITIQKVVNLTFADEGIEVVAVNNGDVAERRMAEVKPDLVLADIFMPGKNGYELCESIKNSQFRNVPVVLLVGAFEPFDQAEARRVRADAHLTKPFESRTLVETVRKLINVSAQSAGGPVAAMSDGGDDVEADSRDELREERDTGSITARVTSAPAPRLDLSAMMMDAPSPVSPRSTGEITSRMNDFGSGSFEIDFTAAAAHESVTATLIDTDQPFETMELASSGFTAEQFRSTLDLESSEPVIDFEKSDLAESPVVSLDSTPGSVLEIDLAGSDGVEIAALDMSTGERSREEQSSPFDAHSETAFEANAPGLIAAEEPLGDVLEGAVASQTAQTSSASEPLSFELGEVESNSSATTVGASLESSGESFGESSGDVEETRRDDRASHDGGDWTSPRAGSYSTAQLDSIVMPAEVATYLANKSHEASQSADAAQEASFSTPANWKDEEPHFTAIDIEAVSVEESFASPGSGSSAPVPANGAPASSELSAASIEAIVRRVIAEMSDSVVREVAWEVVPDCVERVVDQLTRESLSRRA